MGRANQQLRGPLFRPVRDLGRHGNTISRATTYGTTSAKDTRRATCWPESNCRADRDIRWRAVMDYYRRGKDRNWINVSLHFGIGRSSADFRIILGRFREYSRYWNAYYAHRHPGRVPPPVYRHGWSYFRPDAPHRRPAPKPPRPSYAPRTLRVRKCRATVPPFRRGHPGSAAAAFEHRPAAAPRIPSAEPKIHLRT